MLTHILLVYAERFDDAEAANEVHDLVESDMLCRVLLKRLLRGLDEVKLELLLVLGSLGEFLLKCRFCHVLVEAEVLHRHGRERVELAGFGGGIREALQSSTLDGSHGAGFLWQEAFRGDEGKVS